MFLSTSVKAVGFWCLVALALFSPSLRAEEPIRLREQFAAGYQYHVSTRVDLEGCLTIPPVKGQPSANTLKVSGASAIEYDESVLAMAEDGQVAKTARIYRRIDFRRQVGDRPQQNTLRREVRRLVLLRHQQIEVPFSPDGPLTWNELDLIRTDVFTPALNGLLPDGLVRVGDHWTAANLAIQELTDLEKIEEGKVECRLEQLTVIEKRRHARLAFHGTVRGVNEDGPNRQQLEGYCFFDLESNHLSYLYLKGVNFLLDKEGKTLGRVEGKFVLTRQAPTRSSDLSAEDWKGVAVEPNADNTLLLYDNPDLGVRFLHPRRWHVAGVHGRQLALDEKHGNGLLITLEGPGKTPTGTQFHAEVGGWLRKQKAQVWRAEPPRRLQGAPHELEYFSLDVELGGQRVEMQYYVIRQNAGGATVAARLLPADLAGLQPDVDRITRSIRITK